MLSERPRKRSRKWAAQDFRFGYKIMNSGGKKTLDLVRSIANPFPSATLINKKLNFMSTKPGIQTHIRTYINFHLRHSEVWKNNGNLSVVGFDEMSLVKLGMYFPKMDMVLGGKLIETFARVYYTSIN